jgi:hypothetical protein
MDREQIKRQLLKNTLIELLNRKFRTDLNKMKFLRECVISQGYLPKNQSFDDSDSGSEVEYSELKNSDYYPNESQPEYSDLVSLTRPFQRTFIQSPENNLLKIQKRAITNRETEYNKVAEIIDSAVNVMSQYNRNIDPEKIKRDALDMYLRIMEFYASGNNVAQEIEANTKSIKKGYIALVVSYALLNNQIVMNDDILVRFFDNNVGVQDLVKPRRYLDKILFDRGSTRPQAPVSNQATCNQILRMLPDKAQRQVRRVVEWFGPDYTTAAIYYICNVTISKGGVSPEKIKASGSNVTQKLLEDNCKPPSSSVISKRSAEITSYYNLRPEQKQELFEI